MISIIIVNYKVKEKLFACLNSIYESKPGFKFEIIVVDNDENKTISKDLKKRFPQVKYLPNENKGFGQGNNVGAKKAKGEFFFFLNPDTILYKGCIDLLVQYLNKHKQVAIVAPLLFDSEKKLIPLQGARNLTPLNAIFAFSFISKMFPNNNIARKYWMLDQWDKSTIHKVETIPGTAFLIRKSVFEEIKGFDEHFFLYYEEHDLCKRVTKLGWKIVMHPKAKVEHHLGASTKQSSLNIENIAKRSRYYYLKKHYGKFQAFLAEIILRFNKYLALLLFILVTGAFLRLYYLSETMWFIGDQGWFYLSARDMIVSGNIPLVGIPSSHPWLHQGAFWTYMLSTVFWLFGFNPLNGGYLAVALDILAIILFYKIGSSLWSRKIGIIAAFLYATSPLIVINARMPYHTSPIPLVTIVFIYCFYKWVSGSKYYFPLTIMILAILYNFEIATILLGFFTGLVFIYGLLRRKKWITSLLNQKIIFLSICAFFLPMIPMLVFDLSHNFSQTLGVILWIGYRSLLIFGYPALHQETHVDMSQIMSFITTQYHQLIFPNNNIISMLVLLASTYFCVLQLINRKRGREMSILVLILFNIFLILGFISSKSPSQAYLPMIFPFVLFLVAHTINYLLAIRIIKLPVICLLIIIGVMNSYYLIQSYSANAALGGSFRSRVEAAEKIVYESKGKEYNFIRKGIASEFESLSMNYEYLTWWMGHPPSKNPQKLQFIIEQYDKGTRVHKIVKP